MKSAKFHGFCSFSWSRQNFMVFAQFMKSSKFHGFYSFPFSHQNFMVEAGNLTFEMGIKTLILFLRIENSPKVLKEASLRLLLYLPCNPHIHYRRHIWQDIFCSSYVKTIVTMGIVAVVKATFSFSYTSLFFIKKNSIRISLPISKVGFLEVSHISWLKLET